MQDNRKSKKKKMVWIVSGAGLLAVVGLLLILGSAGRPPKPAVVGAAAAESGPLDDVISASGVFKPDSSSLIVSQTGGRVESILVKPGDEVRAGTAIVRIEDRDARLSLLSAEIALEETRRNLMNQFAELRTSLRLAETARAQAERSLENAKALKAVGGITEEAWNQASESMERAVFAKADAREALRLAQGLGPSEDPVMDASRDGDFIVRSPAYRRASITLENARRALDACSVRAESSGTVIELSVAPGSAVQAGSAIARIEDLSSVIAEVNVDEVDIGKLKRGQSAAVSADSLFGKELSGTVSSIWPLVKSSGAGRVCLVEIEVDLGGNAALSGATCVARIKSRLKENALVIPAAALIPGASPPAVWLLSKYDSAEADAKADSSKGGKAASRLKASKREVAIGASTASKVEIISGLSAGDLVAIDGFQGLSEGAPASEKAGAK